MNMVGPLVFGMIDPWFSGGFCRPGGSAAMARWTENIYLLNTSRHYRNDSSGLRRAHHRHGRQQTAEPGP